MCSHENRLICPICKIRGHSIQLCPDKWRRYHSTTEPNEYPIKKVEYNPMRYCCICACEGHLPQQCRSFLRFSEYPPIVTDIKSYAKSYNDDLKLLLGRNVTGYSLISRPCDSVLFKYPVKITTKQYYGRFLNGVGLDHLMNWTEKDKPKRKAESPSKDEPNNKAHKKNYVLNPFAKRCKKSNKLSENKPEGSSNEAAQDKNIETNIVLNTSESSDKRKDKGELPESQSTSHISKTSKPSEDHTLKQNINSKTDQNDETNIYRKFSEQVSSSTPNSKRSKCRKLGPLPDYIPLNDSDDDDEESGSVLGNTKKTTSPKNDDMGEDDEETLSVNEGVPCEAKIYLTKFHSRFLLSPEGQKYLADDSKKFDVKTRIEWTSVRNQLIIDGLPSNQDKFHQDLLETFRKLSDNANREHFEKSQKVPKKRVPLIGFIQEYLLKLDKNLGNVTKLYKRLQNDRNIPTKNSWKDQEKTRKTLNMILMGQAGLRKGKDNLQILLNNLKSLKEDNVSEKVPDNIRDIIGECWKYIFSSQDHENYEELIQKYLDMKKKNELPKVKLNYHLLDRKVLDVSLTDEQKQNIFKDDGKENHTGKVGNSPNPVAQTPSSTPSIFWSRECIKFTDACLAMNPSFSSVSAKLLRVQEKARLGLLSNNDYTALLKIHNVLKGKSGFKRRY